MLSIPSFAPHPFFYNPMAAPSLTHSCLLPTTQASSSDCLCLRAEQSVAALTLRFTPLDRLPMLNTSLYATLTADPALTSQRGRQQAKGRDNVG